MHPMEFVQLDSGKNPMGEGKQENGTSESSNLILTTPYHLAAKSAIFREKYTEHIGYTVQAKHPKSIRLGINALDVYKSIECLGFKKLGEDMAEHLVPDEEKLTMLVMTSRDNPALHGPSYLMMKPLVGLMRVLCSKWLFIQTLRQIEERMRLTHQSFLNGSGNLFSHEDFVPFTLCMDDAHLEEILAKRPGTYLAKPVRSATGQCQQLVSIRAGRVHEDLLNFLVSSQFQQMERSQVILQQYIERPLLVDKRKFDIRVYLLVANPKRGGGHDGRPRQSGFFAFHHPGFVSLCSAPYDPRNADVAAHLASRSVQAQLQTDTASRLQEVTTWYPDELNAYLNRRRRVPRRDWAKDVLYPRVGATLGYVASVFRCYMEDRDCPTSTFRILGVDLMVDESLRLHLLEINECPSWSRQTSVLGNIKPNLWRETICLMSEVAIRYKTYRTVSDDRLVSRQNYRMVYSSEDPSLARRNVTLMYD